MLKKYSSRNPHRHHENKTVKVCFVFSLSGVRQLDSQVHRLVENIEEQISEDVIRNQQPKQKNEWHSQSIQQSSYAQRRVLQINIHKSNDKRLQGELFFLKKLLLAAFYHLTYQHDSKDFNICNYK